MERYEQELLEHLEGLGKTQRTFCYSDGHRRPFGQSYTVPAYGERECTKYNNSDDRFIYEGRREKTPYRAPGKQRREDTRSLYDDPRLQELR